MSQYNDRTHRRFNPLIDEWVLVSPHRTQRPWQGQVEAALPEDRPEYDAGCYLCRGNIRANGERNPAYSDTYIFANDFAALLPESSLDAGSFSAEESAAGLLRSASAAGECRVLCFSPRHDLSLGAMEVGAIRRVVDMWADQITDVGSRLQWVQIFENKGAAMGASNPHPHGQVWACDYLPTLVAKENTCQAAYFDRYGRILLCDLVEQEIAAGERIVALTKHWALIVPFWAIWPFEYLLLPRRHVRRLPDLTDGERNDLAAILKSGITAYDRLFECSFPYSMGWHGAPTDGGEHDGWQLHAHFYPPLLRSATVRKFMVGFELLAEAQRDLTAETAASRLRSLV